MKEKIIKNVRIFREKANYSQEEIAEKMNITQSKYARFERGATKTVEEKEESLKKINEYYEKNKIKPGGIAAKANMVKRYNECNSQDNKED